MKSNSSFRTVACFAFPVDEKHATGLRLLTADRVLLDLRRDFILDASR